MKKLLIMQIARRVQRVCALLLLLLSASYALAQCVPAPSGLVSWWPAEGDATDASGVNPGYISNNLTFAQGEVGLAFNFDGSSNYAIVPASAALDVGQGQGFTIEAWINPVDTGPRPIVEWNPNAGTYGVHLWITQPADLYVNIFDTQNNSHAFVSSGGPLTINAFQHVALTYDQSSGVARVFFNGTILVETNLGSFIPQTSYDMYIGFRPPGAPYGQHAFNGLIDELSLYARALSDTEIQTIYAAGSYGKCGLPPAPPAVFSQPKDQIVRAEGAARFNVVVTGTPPMSYQWALNGNSIPNATNSVLNLTNVQPSQAGLYSVTITNPVGSVASSNAQLKVTVVSVYANGVLLTNSPYYFGSSVSVRLTNAYPSGSIFYTLDGSEPSFLSTQYSAPLVVTSNVILRAIGYNSVFSQEGETDPITLISVPLYTLSVTNNGGGGSVALNPPSGPYLSNTVVNLTATPASGWSFLQWLGDLSGTNPVASVTMTRNRTVKAIFGTTLNTTVAGSGSVVLNPPGRLYPYGTIVWLSGIPLPGNYFGVWGNAASGNVNPLAFTVTNANPTVSSLFAAVPAGQASLTVVPVGKGRVTVVPRANVYTTGQGVNISATPDPGQLFLGWSGDAIGIANPLAVTMTTNKAIYANFTHNPSLSFQASYEGLKPEGFVSTLTGDFGARYEIDASSNLVNWVALTTVTNSFGSVTFTDPAAPSLQRRFYRALLLP